MTRRRKWLLGSGIALLVLALSFPWWISLPGSFLVDSDTPSPADSIVVLGGDQYGFRVNKAVALVRQGIAPRVVVSGNNWYFGLWECELAIDQAVKQGQPRDLFTPFRHAAGSTDEELQAIFAEAKKQGWKSIVIVTSNYHTRRTHLLAERHHVEGLRVQVVASEDGFFRPDEWWWHRESRKVLFLEWTKLLAAVVGGL